jgi:hypothetical protein
MREAGMREAGMREAGMRETTFGGGFTTSSSKILLSVFALCD